MIFYKVEFNFKKTIGVFLLLGDSYQQNITKPGFIGASNNAYKRVYPKIAKVIGSGQLVRVKYIDFDSAVRHV